MCAPIPLGVHPWRSSFTNNPHSLVFSARRAPAIESRQNTILPPIPQDIPQNTAPKVEASLTLSYTPVNTPPSTVLSPSVSVSIPGLSSQGIQALSVVSSMSTVHITSSTYIPSSPLSVATLPLSFTPNLASSQTVLSTALSTVLPSSGSADSSSMVASISWSVSSTYDTTSSLVSTTTIIPVIPQSSDSTVTTTSYTSIQSTETDNPLSESFTPTPSPTLSTFTDSSSLAITSSSPVITSSTTNDTAPAVNTATTSPISVKPVSLNAHNPSLYIGIVLGTLAAIACLCALIAWLIRLRSHARRRRAAESLKLPWAKSDDSDTWGLESGHGLGSDANIAAIGAMNLGSREDLANVQAWSPRGDRDVGEPRRAESSMKGSTYSLQNHPIPEHCLFSDDSVRAFTSSEGYSTTSLLPHHNLRQLPSHLIDQELAARVSLEHASLRSNDNIDRTDFSARTNGGCGTPRETMNNPRFLSLRGDGLNVPWHQNSERSPRSMVERLRNHGKPLPTEPPWEQILPRQNSGEIDKKSGEAEPWSTSFRNSLVSAFNAVAANLPLAARAPHMNDDGFTAVPPKRTVRKSVRDTFWDDDVLKAKEVSRETSVSTVTSTAWTLEETREGAGVVRLFIPGLQGCGDETAIQRPHLSGPTLSFSDGDDVISDGYDSSKRLVERPQVPLIASEKPPPAVMRPDPYHRRRSTRKTVNPSFSRAGSVYSTASMHVGTPAKNLAFQIPPIASRIPLPSANPYYDDTLDSIVIEPSQISRLSSTDSSVTSTIDGSNSVVKEDLNVASQALNNRRTRVL
ncbi:hypothetical protein BYT27DRAFT_7342513 [Phlegmacium glaucopus]|nr:hypothetical protein BYT27DRAFT_7342513 [Phlegmacium glaucopus]